MATSVSGPEQAPLGTIRTWLLWSLVLGAAGTTAELLLIGHDESPAQFVPLVLLAAGIIIGVSLTVAPSPLGVRLFRALMVLYLASGPLGIGLHYQGNEEFELERQPSASGLALMTKTLRGATPVLAPGSMSLLGAIGLAFSHRHPLLRSDTAVLPSS
jgi:hypothetical protein